MTMHNRRVAVRAIILENDKLLCVRLKKYPGKIDNEGQDYWCTPGGGVEIGEPLMLALDRELIEETGVKPVIGPLLYIQQFEHADWEHLEFFFQVMNVSAYRTIDLTATTHGAVEIAEIDFIDPSAHRVLPAFLAKRNIASDAEQRTVHIFNALLSQDD
jgi:8-oxo-dGTP diphosphatase